jgi:hypothetical protein
MEAASALAEMVTSGFSDSESDGSADSKGSDGVEEREGGLVSTVIESVAVGGTALTIKNKMVVCYKISANVQGVSCESERLHQEFEELHKALTRSGLIIPKVRGVRACTCACC